VAGGLVWLAQIEPDGSYVTTLLLPSLVVGVGEGAVWVSSMVGATTGTDESESGLASGLVNTAQQLGGALGVAVLVALATSQTSNEAVDGAPSVEALTDGFAGGAVIAALGAVLAAVLLSPRHRRSPDGTGSEAAPRTAEATA
jgi:MFS family permease